MCPWMRLEKKDLYMFLARLMEEFPECHAPSDEFNKTGIVICESDRVQKIVAMSFSKPGLHAIEQIIHCLPSSLRNCTVYLSRKPCTTCTTFLIQDPPLPYLKKEELCIYLALHMEKKSETAGNAGIVVCEASKPKRIIALGCATKELHAVPKVLLRFPNALKGCEVYMSRKPCNYCAILLVQAQVSQVYYWPNIETNMAEKDKRDHVDAIFTESYVVAATYVPTIDDVALGYSGYPKGSMNSLFCKGGDFDQHAIVCAEANAIIMSSERDLSNAELITSRRPCDDCLKLIRAKNIAKVIWPLRDRNVDWTLFCIASFKLICTTGEGASVAAADGEPE
ncbi:hypothetical protein Q9233_003980 [Columba guinea]|nr:hypothetical protein Q9233_003980 [Columba guinea]